MAYLSGLLIRAANLQKLERYDSFRENLEIDAKACNTIKKETKTYRCFPMEFSRATPSIIWVK